MPPRGFTYLALLFWLAFLALGAALAAEVASREAQREGERQLLFVGEQYREAIGRWHDTHAALADPFPRDLGWLLEDLHSLEPQRYLRQVYRDPITGSPQWGLVRSPLGGITGVYSLSQARPLKQAGFDLAERDFTGAQHYSGWRFVYVAKPKGPSGLNRAATPTAYPAGSPAQPPRSRTQR
jgi:hypothetical protein